MDVFSIFAKVEYISPHDLRVMNYYQLYTFWNQQLKELVKNTTIDYNTCFIRKFVNDPFSKVSCLTVILIVLSYLDEDEFKFLKDLHTFTINNTDTVFRNAMFKIFTVIANLEQVVQDRFSKELMFGYRNIKSDYIRTKHEIDKSLNSRISHQSDYSLDISQIGQHVMDDNLSMSDIFQKRDPLNLNKSWLRV